MASIKWLAVALFLPCINLCEAQQEAGTLPTDKHGRFLADSEAQIESDLDPMCIGLGLTTLECAEAKRNTGDFAEFSNETVFMPEGVGETGSNLLMMVLSALLGPMLPLVLVCIYKSQVNDRRQRLVEQIDMSAGDDFEAGLCDCWSHCPICLQVWFCGLARSGDTLSTAGVICFWAPAVFGLVIFPLIGLAFTAMGLLLAFYVNEKLAQLVYPLLLLAYSAIFAKWRGELRNKLFLHSGDQNHFIKDLMMYCCCMPCAIGQEALELDRLTNMETEILGVRKRTWEETRIVGNPVHLS